MNRIPHLSLLVAAAVVLTACPRRSRDPLDNPKGHKALELTIQHLDRDESWGAVYQFPRPVTEAIFERESYPYRDRWRVISPPGAAVILEDGTTRVSTPGKSEAFETLVLELQDEALPPTGNHPLITRWSDGSRLVFTGHLSLIPCGHDTCEESIAQVHRLNIPQVLQFVPRTGERAVVGGKVISEAGHWRSTGEGTYAYFGKTRPVEREHFVGVVDAGMPGWLRERTESLLPLLFEVYRARTGRTLPERPVVLLGYAADPRAGRLRMSGSVVTGTLQLQIALGTEFRAERHPEVVRRLFRFTSHQAGHLWLGQLFFPESSADVWLQESAVDALGLRALRQLGLLDERQARERSSVALSRCLAESAGQLASGEDVHDTDNCGSALALFSEAATRQKQPGLDLFDLWKAVFDRATEQRYSSNVFYSVVGELAGEDAERRARAIGTPGTRTPELILASLKEAGVEVERGVEPPGGFQRYLGQLAVRHVLDQACAPGVPGTTSSVAPGCERIRDPSDVMQIAGRPPREGSVVYQEVARLCAEQGEIPMTVPESATQPFKLPCSRPLPAMPEYLQVNYTVPVKATTGATD